MEIKSFPINIENIGTFNSEQDIENWIENKECKNNEYLSLCYDYWLINHSSVIYTKEINNWITRYNLLKNYNIQSFGNIVDEMPAVWIDIINIIDQEIPKIQDIKRKTNAQ